MQPRGIVGTSVSLVDDPAGFARFRQLLLEYEASLEMDLRHSDLTHELADLEGHYGPPNAAFVATVDDALAGCIAFAKLDATRAIVKKMYVRPSHRKKGVGRALLATLIELARDRGHERLVLDTERDRLRPAYELYLSLGFRECAPYGEVDYPSPTFMEMKI